MNQIYELVLKRNKIPHSLINEIDSIKDPKGVAYVVRRLTEGDPQESFFAFYFIGVDTLIGYSRIGLGGFYKVFPDNKVILSTALLCGATSIIVAHNHPSGSPRPSRTDIKGMKRFIAAADLIGIMAWDRVIVGGTDYIAMREFGLLPPMKEIVRDAEKQREE